MSKAFVTRETLRPALDLGIQAFKADLKKNVCVTVAAKSLNRSPQLNRKFLEEREHKGSLDPDVIFARAGLTLSRPALELANLKDSRVDQMRVEAALNNPADLLTELMTPEDEMPTEKINKIREKIGILMQGFVGFFVLILKKSELPKPVGHGLAIIPAEQVEPDYRARVLGPENRFLIVDTNLPKLRGENPKDIGRTSFFGVTEDARELTQTLVYDYADPDKVIRIHPVFRHPKGNFLGEVRKLAKSLLHLIG